MVRVQQIKQKSSMNYRGERSKKAKLIYEEVSEIRRLYASGNFTQDYLASQYGVSSSTIHNIVSNKTWNI
ncbi:hypothetical protein [Effusibacillus consociatus]|uniref:HTH psq-type domain-containing protein n=1 Tax=Effusibacillus consociatus TaxID=1117041 RepID=A0ABV9Q5F7_9BACL